MRKWLLLIISIISIVFCQDKLVLKRGASYDGELVRIVGKEIYFSTQKSLGLKPFKLKKIKKLTQDGLLIVNDGKIVFSPIKKGTIEGQIYYLGEIPYKRADSFDLPSNVKVVLKYEVLDGRRWVCEVKIRGDHYSYKSDKLPPGVYSISLKDDDGVFFTLPKGGYISEGNNGQPLNEVVIVDIKLPYLSYADKRKKQVAQEAEQKKQEAEKKRIAEEKRKQEAEKKKLAEEKLAAYKKQQEENRKNKIVEYKKEQEKKRLAEEKKLNDKRKNQILIAGALIAVFTLLFIAYNRKRKIYRKELIDKYGEEDGLLIFVSGLLEEDYFKKKELIEKYGEKDGVLIFNSPLSEEDYLKRKELIDKYGSKDGAMIMSGEITEEDYLRKQELVQSSDSKVHSVEKSSKPNSETNQFFGIISLLLLFISFFLPFYNLGSKGVTLLYIVTEMPNYDLIGIIMIIIGGLMLIVNSDEKIVTLLTVIGVLFPLYRFYKISTVGDVGSYFQPSFGIGGYLIILGAGIQLYASLNQEETKSNVTPKIDNDNQIDELNEPVKLEEEKIGTGEINSDTTISKPEKVDVEKELEKLKGMLDKDLITQDDYNAKKKELLGL